MIRFEDLVDKVRSYSPDAESRVAPAGVRVLGPRAQGPGSSLGRTLPRPPPGGRQPPCRHAFGRRGRGRRPAPRRGRGHPHLHRARRRALRSRGRPRRRGGHQALQHPVFVQGGPAGRELPAHVPGDGGRHPRHPRQARRPPAQHADPRARPRREAGAHRPRDPRHLRAHRQPAGHEQGQERARGAVFKALEPRAYEDLRDKVDSAGARPRG